MSSFTDALRGFAFKSQRLTGETFVNFAGAVKDSITDGSPITGSPGQPVDSSDLKTSWQLDFESATSALVMTKSKYAPPNETGIREDGGPYELRSPVGGRHSVALTIANADRLLEHVVNGVRQ